MAELSSANGCTNGNPDALFGSDLSSMWHEWRNEIPAIGFVVIEHLAAMGTGMAARVID